MAFTRRRVDLAIIGLAIAIRVVAVLLLQSHHVPRSSYEHGEMRPICSRDAAFRCDFWGQTARHRSRRPSTRPRGGGFAIGGVDSPSPALLELGQSLLGGVLVLGVLRLTRSLAPAYPPVASTAALVVALHPTLVYAATHVQVASLATTLLVWTLALAYETGATGRSRHAVYTGLLLALLALTDPILALVALGILCVLWQSRIRRQDGFRECFACS